MTQAATAIRALFDGDARPRIVVLARAWSPALAPAGELAAVRAHLRGAGAELLVIGEALAWTVRPDDDAIEPARCDARAIAPRLGVRDGADAVFAVDGSGDVRYASVPVPVPALARLVEAAVAALFGRPSMGLVFSRRAWLQTAAAAGAAAALWPACRHNDRAPDATGDGSEGGAGSADIVLRVNGEQPRAAHRPARVAARRAARAARPDRHEEGLRQRPVRRVHRARRRHARACRA